MFRHNFERESSSIVTNAHGPLRLSNGYGGPERLWKWRHDYMVNDI
jgi:hypothetical protein